MVIENRILQHNCVFTLVYLSLGVTLVKIVEVLRKIRSQTINFLYQTLYSTLLNETLCFTDKELLLVECTLNKNFPRARYLLFYSIMSRVIAQWKEYVSLLCLSSIKTETHNYLEKKIKFSSILFVPFWQTQFLLTQIVQN